MDPFDLGQVLILVVSQALTHLASFVLFKSSLVAVLADPNHAGLLIKFESLGDSWKTGFSRRYRGSHFNQKAS